MIFENSSKIIFLPYSNLPSGHTRTTCLTEGVYKYKMWQSRFVIVLISTILQSVEDAKTRRYEKAR
jgi:hypothetical protein